MSGSFTEGASLKAAEIPWGAMSQPKTLIKSLSYAIGRFVFRKKYMIAHSPRYGLKLKFRTPDGGGRAIYKRGLYEEPLTNYLVRELECEDGDLIFDVGANIGWYSCLLSRHHPGVRIFCFEPDPENYELLRGNLKRNSVERVHAAMMGIGEKTETRTLYLYKKSNVGRHSMLDINEGPTIDVEVTSLDEFVEENDLDFERVAFLKIDIEGFEYFAFKGAEKLLRHVPLLLAEFSPGYMREGGVEPADLLELLHGHGFDPFSIEGLDLISRGDEELLDRNRNINLLWLREGHPLRP